MTLRYGSDGVILGGHVCIWSNTISKANLTWSAICPNFVTVSPKLPKYPPKVLPDEDIFYIRAPTCDASGPKFRERGNDDPRIEDLRHWSVATLVSM